MSGLLAVSFLCYMFELIADARYSHNVPEVCRVGFELDPQTTYEDMQVLCIIPVLGTPDLIQEMDMSENLSRIKYKFL